MIATVRFATADSFVTGISAILAFFSVFSSAFGITDASISLEASDSLVAELLVSSLADTDSLSEPEVDSDRDSLAEADSLCESETDSERDSDTDSEIDSDTDSLAKVEADSLVDCDSDSESFSDCCSCSSAALSAASSTVAEGLVKATSSAPTTVDVVVSVAITTSSA
ncbi:hypothetical protein [Streptococcus acidominimus]|uniref:hypothetical protein n=1 Tax=Streptococcus acidominimus TaxID=1326 RepID=UPI000E1BE3AB|nr:hypothetical protein [Streptococcus acidominimus]